MAGDGPLYFTDLDISLVIVFERSVCYWESVWFGGNQHSGYTKHLLGAGDLDVTVPSGTTMDCICSNKLWLMVPCAGSAEKPGARINSQARDYVPHFLNSRLYTL